MSEYTSEQIQQIIDENARLKNQVEVNSNRRHQKIVEYIRENRNDGRSREKLAIEMKKRGLCAKSSAIHYLSMLPIIDEYVRQETE